MNDSAHASPHFEAAATLSSTRDWRSMAMGLAVLLALAALVWWGMSQGGAGKGAPKRQTAKVALLPDTPPPPPKEEPKKEPPKEEPKETVQLNRPQPTPTPAPPGQQLKAEGAAGEGGSPFAAGSVSKDYTEGKPGGGGASAPAAPVDRQKFRLFADGLTRRLQSELERHLGGSELPRMKLSLQVWLDDSGEIARYEMSGLSRPELDREVRESLDKAKANLRSRPPAGMPQPINLSMTVMPQGG